MGARFKEFTKAELTPEQIKVWDGVAGARKGAFPTPFQVLLENPDLCRTVTDVGVICRYKTGLSPRLSELAILTVATHWRCAYEFAVHTPEARKGGVPEHEIAALKEGRRPDFADADAALVHAFATSCSIAATFRIRHSRQRSRNSATDHRRVGGADRLLHAVGADDARVFACPSPKPEFDAGDRP